MKNLFILLLLLTSSIAFAQQSSEQVDALKAKLSKAKTPAERIEIMGDISILYMNTSIANADKYGSLISREAEISRDRKLIVKALMINGRRYASFPVNKVFMQKAVDYAGKAVQTAKANKLDKETAEALLLLSSIYASLPDLEKAFNSTTQASSIASTLKNDTLLVTVYHSLGNIYQLKKERILALRNYFNGLTLSEELKDHRLLRNSYTLLSRFYSDIGDYDKAIDFTQKSIAELAFLDKEKYKYNVAHDAYLLGNLYMLKKDYDMSGYYYERSIKLADSIKYAPLKIYGYNGLLSQYMVEKQPQKALQYFNSSKEMQDFLINIGMSHVIDNSYGSIYTELKKFDSAQYYFKKAEPGVEATGTSLNKWMFYYQYAHFFEESGNAQKAIEYYNKANAVANETANLEWQQEVAKALDSAYIKAGNYEQSRLYSGLYNKYKDSLQKLSEEKDLIAMEVNNEQLRQERIAKEEAEKKKARHNIQYLGITLGIAFLFIVLVMMGMFKVSASTVKLIGFFSFLMLFEFIFLVFKKNIYSITQGEPWKDLAFMLLIATILVPLHHKMEHKVVHYLLNKKLLLINSKSILRKVFSSKEPVDHH